MRRVAVLLMSHFSNITCIQKQISLRDSQVLPREKMIFISRNVVAFLPKKRGNETDDELAAHRHATELLDGFECGAYEMSRNEYLSSNHTTLDYDL